MNKQLDKQLRLAKQASLDVFKLSAEKRVSILLAIAEELRNHKEEIFAANKIDVNETKKKGKTNAFLERLTLSEKGFERMASQVEIIAKLDDILGEEIEKRTLVNGILLKKIRFSLGVVAMIYESRPNVTVDVAGLCLKSGNAVILKGGSEALNTNKALVNCIHKVLRSFGLSTSAVTFLDNVTHDDIVEMLTRSDLIDVVIPRGSYALSSAVAQSARIPILYHSAGGARAYIDKSANLKIAVDLVVNAKVQRNSVCNALDCILIHEAIVKDIITNLAQRLTDSDVEIRADEKARKYIQAKKAIKEDYSTEFLDAIVLIKVVKDENEALEFMKKYSHHHTEMLIAENKEIIEKFVNEVDTAALMINCSSRLHDGGEFGMGAEMGTATGKFHARGPVGIRELTTYKWIAYGNGQMKK